MKKLIYPIAFALTAFLILYSCSAEEEDTTPPPQVQQPTPEPEPKVSQFTLTVTAGEGGTVSTEGGTYDEGTEVTINATPNEGFVFSGWEGNDSNSDSLTITVNSETTLQAIFSQAFSLEINQGEGGSIIGEAGAYTSETEITLEAIPADGYIFKNWVGISETSPSVTITLSEDLVVSAVFIEQSQTAFISKWNIGENKQIKITLSESYNYNFSIDWGDGTSETFEGNISEITHEYANSGEFDITIEKGENGSFPYIKIDDPTSRVSIVEISQWGNVSWESFTKSFRDCENLDITATDSPILSNVEQMNEAFWGCISLVNENESISNWDMSNVIDISYIFLDTKIDIPLNWDLSNTERLTSVFEQTNFNQDLSNWDITSAQYINGLFFNNESFNQDISGWNTSNVISMNRTFLASRSFNQNISGWDVSNVTDMQFMFGSANKFNQDISDWDVSNVQRFDYMFSKADSFDQNLAEWDISSMESAAGMFQNVTLSTDNYDEILIGWSRLLETETKIPENITIDFGNSKYSVCGGGNIAREKLIQEYNWTIQDGGRLEENEFSDYDGNLYSNLEFGNQIWTNKNLIVKHYKNGDPIPFIEDREEWASTTSGAWTYYFNNEENFEKFGIIYNGYALKDSRGLFPDGYKVPSSDEWNIFLNHLISEGYNFDGTKEGNKVAKSIASEDYWADSNTLGTPGNDSNSNNQSGFNSTPGGSRDGNGYWQASGDFSLMWTSDNKAAKLLKFSVDLGITDGASDKWGYYIRLIKVCN
jgi:uncharacterized protein (TIGR02145 family)